MPAEAIHDVFAEYGPRCGACCSGTSAFILATSRLMQ
jgi:hypothetical protein